jgi:hypothetical protein
MTTAFIAGSFIVASLINLLGEYPHDPPATTYVNFAIGIGFGLLSVGMLIGEVWK